MPQTDLEGLFETTAPFDLLKPDERARLIETVERLEVPSGSAVLEVGQLVEKFYLVVSGQIEVASATGKIFGRLARGETFGLHAMREGRRSSYRAKAIADCALRIAPRASRGSARADADGGGGAVRVAGAGAEGGGPEA